MIEQSLWSAALIAGLLGGGHCIGMCGGIVSSLTMALPPGRREPRQITGMLLGYNLGRISSYIVAGFIAGSLGQLLGQSWMGVAMGLRALAALMLVLMALYIGRWWSGLIHIETLGKGLWQRIEPLGRRLFPVRHGGQAFLLGSLWGWLPCGLVYSMLIMALSSGSGLYGALIMLAFGLGTLPTLLVTGFMADRLRAALRHPIWRHLAALILLLFALWQLAPLWFQLTGTS